MDRDEIRASLERILKEVFDEETFEFSESLSRETLESWDSLGHIRLVSAIEEAFDIRFTLDEIEELTSANRIIECIGARN
jgi:acyl carrier protein